MKYSKKADALFNEMTNRIVEIVKVKGSKDGFKTAKVIALAKCNNPFLRCYRDINQ